MSKSIYVGNIPDQATEEEVTALFAPFGSVLMGEGQAPYFPKREEGGRKGFAFYRMDDAEADAAIAGMTDAELHGQKLTVNEARPRS